MVLDDAKGALDGCQVFLCIHKGVHKANPKFMTF